MSASPNSMRFVSQVAGSLEQLSADGVIGVRQWNNGSRADRIGPMLPEDRSSSAIKRNNLAENSFAADC